jgi:hypothetical protein
VQGDSEDFVYKGVDDPPPTDESGDVDLEQIRHNLSLTPLERLQQNDRWAELVTLFREAGRAFYGDKAAS